MKQVFFFFLLPQHGSRPAVADVIAGRSELEQRGFGLHTNSRCASPLSQFPTYGGLLSLPWFLTSAISSADIPASFEVTPCICFSPLGRGRGRIFRDTALVAVFYFPHLLLYSQRNIVTFWISLIFFFYLKWPGSCKALLILLCLSVMLSCLFVERRDVWGGGRDAERLRVALLQFTDPWALIHERFILQNYGLM